MSNSKKILFSLVFIAVLLFAIFLLSKRKSRLVMDVYTLYIGGYGEKAYKYTFNTKGAEFTKIAEYTLNNPSFLTLSPKGEYIFISSENGRESAQYSFSNTNPPAQLSIVKVREQEPCYITYYKNYIFSANYGDGTISIFPIDSLGKLNASVQRVAFSRDSERPNQKSRIHTVKTVKGRKSDNEYIIATDLGLDRLYFFRIESDSTFRIALCDTAFLQLPKGYGPRHIDFSKDGRYLYLMNEKSDRVVAYSIGEENNNLILREIQDILADRYNSMASADIHLGVDGKFLYTSHRRNNDGISIFKVEADGSLTKKGYQVTGSYPRYFTITPDGRYMFVACQREKKIQLFEINEKNGFLSNTNKEIIFTDLEPSCIVVK